MRNLVKTFAFVLVVTGCTTDVDETSQFRIAEKVAEDFGGDNIIYVGLSKAFMDNDKDKCLDKLPFYEDLRSRVVRSVFRIYKENYAQVLVQKYSEQELVNLHKLLRYTYVGRKAVRAGLEAAEGKTNSQIWAENWANINDPKNKKQQEHDLNYYHGDLNEMLKAFNLAESAVDDQRIAADKSIDAFNFNKNEDLMELIGQYLPLCPSAFNGLIKQPVTSN